MAKMGGAESIFGGNGQGSFLSRMGFGGGIQNPQQLEMMQAILAGANRGAAASGSPIMMGLTPLLSAMIGAGAVNDANNAQQSRDDAAMRQLVDVMQGTPQRANDGGPQPARAGASGGMGLDEVAGTARTPASSVPPGVDLALGPNRPNPPSAQLMQMLSAAAQEALGQGARVEIYSGQENAGRQYGSNRHRTGLAADVRVFAPDGQQITLEDPRAERFATTAARMGARGIGAGSEYMGNAFHIDMVPHSEYGPNQGPVWGDWATQRRAQLVGAMGQGDGVAATPLAQPGAAAAPARATGYRATAQGLIDQALNPTQAQPRQASPDAVRALLGVMSGQNVSDPLQRLAGNLLQQELRGASDAMSPQDQLRMAQQLISIDNAMNPQAGDRQTHQDAAGYWRFVDSGERVFPDAVAPPRSAPSGQERQENAALARLSQMVDDTIISRGLPDGEEGRQQAYQIIAQDPIGKRLIEIARVTIGAAPPAQTPPATGQVSNLDPLGIR
ncbi:MAG: hypothetical protein AAF674_19745 [Pseudomonadota bacterium]